MMGDNDSTGGWGCTEVIVAGIVIVIVMALFGGGMTAGDTTSTTTTQTETNVHVLSDNEVNILSPTFNTYVNTGDTTTRVEGDRNNVAAQTGGGQCWVTSANAWGPCPAWAQPGSGVP